MRGGADREESRNKKRGERKGRREGAGESRGRQHDEVREREIETRKRFLICAGLSKHKSKEDKNNKPGKYLERGKTCNLCMFLFSVLMDIHVHVCVYIFESLPERWNRGVCYTAKHKILP